MDYKVEKTPQRVDVLWEGNTLKEEEIVLFLNRFSPYRRGEEETMEEYLENAPDFIPCNRASDGSFFLLSLSSILYLREKATVNEEGSTKMRLHFGEEISLEVEQVQPLPHGRTRPLDILNTPSRFLSFLYGGRRLFTNRSRIRWADPL